MLNPIVPHSQEFRGRKMQTSGMICDEKEDTIFDIGHQSMDLSRLNWSHAGSANHALDYFFRTTLTERVVEFLERYN